eukprot:scaffold32124_cov77-Phaeocystis_antarctica.AAC.8
MASPCPSTSDAVCDSLCAIKEASPSSEAAAASETLCRLAGHACAWDARSRPISDDDDCRHDARTEARTDATSTVAWCHLAVATRAEARREASLRRRPPQPKDDEGGEAESCGGDRVTASSRESSDCVGSHGVGCVEPVTRRGES